MSVGELLCGTFIAALPETLHTYWVDSMQSSKVNIIGISGVLSKCEQLQVIVPTLVPKVPLIVEYTMV